MRVKISLSIALLVSAIGLLRLPIALAADDSRVDRQETAIATNLGLYGGSPQDIAVDPNDDGQYVYVTTYTPNGIFSSSDSGVTWNGVSSEFDFGAGKGIAIDPATGTVYVAIGDNVIMSEDHGTTWTSLTANLANAPIIGSPILWTNNTLIVAESYANVQVSSDGGASFTEAAISDDTQDEIVSLAGDNAGTVYAVTRHTSSQASRIFVSADNGSSWIEMDVESGGVEDGSLFYSAAVDPLNTDHVILTSYHPDYDSYQSFDAGTTWTALQNDGNRIGGQEALFDGVGGLYLGSYYTSDASVESPTWTALSSDTPLSSLRGDIYAVDAVHPTTVFSNSSMGVAKSEDTGSTWIDSIDGITAVKTYAISQATDKDIVWLGATGGLAKTTNFTDDEPDWLYPVLPSESASTIYAVWVQPDDSDYVVTASSNFLYYTSDGGDTWTQADAPDFNGTVQDIIPSTSSSDTLYALYVNTSLVESEDVGGVLKSVDAGQTWEDMEFPTDIGDGSIAVASQDDVDVVYVGLGSGGAETGIYKYSSSAWEKLDEDFGGFYSNFIFVHPNDPAVLFATFEADSTEGALYKTTDGGSSWEVITDGIANANHLGVIAEQSGDTSTLYLAGQDNGTSYGMLYKSTDGGESWSEYYQGLRQEFFYDLLFDGLVSGNDRGVFSLKSLAKVVLKKQSLGDRQHRLRVTLKDAATLDVLANKHVLVYKKPRGKAWRIIQTGQTNDVGVVRFTVHGKKNDRFKVVWKPRNAARAEYARSVSRIVQVQ